MAGMNRPESAWWGRGDRWSVPSERPGLVDPHCPSGNPHVRGRSFAGESDLHTSFTEQGRSVTAPTLRKTQVPRLGGRGTRSFVLASPVVEGMPFAAHGHNLWSLWASDGGSSDGRRVRWYGAGIPSPPGVVDRWYRCGRRRPNAVLALPGGVGAASGAECLGCRGRGNGFSSPGTDSPARSALRHVPPLLP